MIQSLIPAMRSLMPTADFGIGEFGTEDKDGKQGDDEFKTELIKVVYEELCHHHPVRGWVGGGFYWDFVMDAARGSLLPIFKEVSLKSVADK